MIIIGITGTLGAGKGTIVDYLVKEKNFVHFSVREFLIKEIKDRSMPVNRDTMTMVANVLRANHSSSYIIDKLYDKAKLLNKNSIIESIRTAGEVESLRRKGNFILLAIDADIKIRYQRISYRKSETDNISFETFKANEEREMNSTDPNVQNLAACIALADYKIVNDGSIIELNAKLLELTKEIIG